MEPPGYGGGGGGGATRFTPLPFAHNGRVALALLPSAALAASAAGLAGVGAAIVGAMLTYLLDLLRWGEAALGCAWVTLTAVYLSLVFGSGMHAERRPPLLEVAMLLALGQTLFLIGVWATLQFKWVQLQHPGVVLAAERLVLAAAPLNAAAVVGWGLVASLGAAAAPFYLSAYQAALYAACSLPLRSSFWMRGARTSATSAARGNASVPPEALALAPRDAALHALAAATLPPALYAATHAAALLHPLAPPHGAWAEHASAVILLAAAPPAALCAAAGRGALWWAPPGAEVAREAVALSSAFALAVAFHGRVLRRLLRAYVRVAPPWDVALPALAAACVAAVAGLAASGRLPPPGRRGAPEPPAASAAAALLAAAAVAASLALGMPPWMAPAPLLGAAAAWQFCRHGAPRDYALWGLSSAACLLWFLHRHFWTLDVTLATGAPLRQLCARLAAAAALAGCAPAAARAARGRRAQAAAAILLAAHAALHAACEAALVAEGAAEGEAAAIYPPYLVAATSAAGLALVSAMRRAGRVPPWAAWLLSCVYVAKLALLLAPDGIALPRLTALAAAASGPFALSAPRPRSAAAALAVALHVGAFTVALLAARFELFDALRAAAGGRRPSDATLFGALLLACGAFCAALAARRFPHAAAPRRVAALLAAAGAGLLALRPPLPWKGEVGFWYDAAHVPDVEPDDAGIYGARAGDRAAWPAYLLLAAAQAAVLAATSSRGKASGAASRGDGGLPPRVAVAAAVLGAALGLYAAAEFFPPDGLLRLCVAAPCAAGGVLVASLAASPGAAPPPRWLPALFAAQLAALPAALAALRLGDAAGGGGVLGGRGAAEAAARAAEARAGVLATHAALCCAAAFSVKLKLAAVAAEARGPASAPSAASRTAFAAEAYPRTDPFAPFAARAGAGGAARAPLLAARALAAARATALPPLGNAAAVAAYALCLALSRGVGSGAGCGPAFALPPLLLLLSDDGGLLRGLAQGAARYAPPFAACWLHLTALGAVRAAAAGAAHAADAPWSAARNAVALALAQPCGAVLFRALWGAPPPPDAMLLLFTPLPLAPLALADGAPARLLAMLALAGAAAMHAARSRSRAAAHRLL